MVHALLAGRGNPFPASLVIPSPEAKQVLDALTHDAANKREDGGEWQWCRPHAARLAENTWRLALVFHAIQHPQEGGDHPLAYETAAAAGRVTRWFFAETLALLSPIRSQQTAARMDKLANIFRDKQTDSLPTWILAQNHGFKEQEVRALAAEFPQRLRIVEGTPGPKGGKPSITAPLLRQSKTRP